MPKTYAVKHKDEEIRGQSRSGGIFTAVSDLILERGGVIVGCKLDEDMSAVHKVAITKEERDEFRGSKYIQSDLKTTFREVKALLEEGKEVLFSGTGCQCAGLLSFLGKDYSNLITMDIVCHGVPSPKVWQDYLNYVKNKFKGKNITFVDFRNKKKYGWKAHVETVEVDGVKHHSKVFTTLFYSHQIIRPSCYVCPYKNIHHKTDITIADCWKVDKAAPGFNDNKGVSLVLVNTNRGLDLFEASKEVIDYVDVNIKSVMQRPLKAPFPEPENRAEFWKDYQELSFAKIARKYGGDTDYGLKIVKRKAKSFLRKLKKFVKRVIRWENAKRDTETI